MLDRLLVLIVSKNAELCTFIISAFEADAYKAICAPSLEQAMQLFETGLTADFLLIDASREKPEDSPVLPSLLQKFKSENIGLIVDAEDISWNNVALRWNFATVLTMPIMPGISRG